MASLATQLSRELAAAVSAVAPTVVQVHGRRRPASGVVYAPNLVITTTPAVGSDDRLVVRRHDGSSLDAELAGWDPSTSLALLRVAGLETEAARPSSSAVSVGHLALAVARSWSNAVTASAGIVAVIGGPLPTGRRRSIDRIIRTTAPMHEGFAGGAFIDTEGALLGISTARAIRGLGVVIPADIAWKTAAHLVEHGQVKRGYLGVGCQRVALPKTQQAAGTTDHGLVVMTVTAGSPASAAGILVGDVLVGVDDRPLESVDELLDVLLAAGAGGQVTIRLLRGGTLTNVPIRLGERPPEGRQ
jgi:S1-C subfamily serine protease